jgi:signal transduction histidine kinase
VEVPPEEQAFAAAALVQGMQADAPIGFAIHDDHLRFEVVSQSLAAINGRPAADHLGRRVTEILPGGIAGEVEALLAQVRDSGVPRTGVELDGTTDAAPGEMRTWVAAYYPIEVDGRRLVGQILVDITDRRRAQEALRQSERLLSGAQQMAGIGWWSWTVRPEHVVYAPELLALLGRDPSRGESPPVTDLLELAEPGELRRIRDEGLAALAERRPFACRVRARHADGELRVLDARADVVHDAAGEPVGLQGFVQDITELERAGRRQRIVAELGQAALAGVALEPLMQQAVDGLVDGIAVDGAAVLELLPGGSELAVRTACGAAGAATLPVTRGGVAERALAGGLPVIVADHEQQAAMPILPGARSSAVVVIGGRSGRFGLLCAASRRPGRFAAADDAAFLQSIANTLADAVERRTAEAEIEELSAARGRLVAQALDAEERARRRISETLHDGALQDLLAARHDLYALAGHGGDEAALQAAQDGLGAVVRSLREVMSALHPTVLQYGGLEAALGAVADQQANAGGFAPELRVDPAATGVRDELLLSVARELLSNAARHASASRVEIALRRERDAIVLEVADDGAGLTPERLAEARDEGRIGLASARERMEAVGGSLVVTGGPGSGTRVRAQAPAGSAPGAEISSLHKRPDGA